jgi:hypothetical protein
MAKKSKSKGSKAKPPKLFPGGAKRPLASSLLGPLSLLSVVAKSKRKTK